MKNGCKAKIQMSVSAIDGKWFIKDFVVEHNHKLTTPSKLHYKRSNRKISILSKQHFREMNNANISPSKYASFFTVQNGGYGQMGCMKTNINNFFKKEISHGGFSLVSKQFIPCLNEKSSYYRGTMIGSKILKLLDSEITHFSLV